MNQTLEHREEPGAVSPQGVVLDFDRTLADPAASMSRFYKAIEGFPIDAQSIADAQDVKESTGGSFEPFSYLKSMLSDAEMNAFKHRFISMEEPPLFYDDVPDFLTMLNQNNMPYTMLSKGMNKEWQELKIIASGYKGPFTIIDHDNKGEEIAGKRTPYGTFLFHRSTGENIQTRSVCLIDDKPKAFSGLPNDCSGFLVVRRSKTLPSQQGVVPAHVAPIKSLQELRVVNGVLRLRLP